MQVSRVEIFGFKSFMEKLVLPLDGGVTGVVGPNGCGKSNIVDAIRWVLGETRAKSLRGGTLEDVIFNGTDKLKPLGLAEVSIVLRSDDENFFQDLVSQNLEADVLLDEINSQIKERISEDIIEEDISEDSNVKELKDSNQENHEVAVQTQDIDKKQAKPKFTVVTGSKENSNSEEDTDEVGNEEVQNLTSKQGSSVTPESARLLNRMGWLKSAQEIQVTRRLYRSGESEYFINKVSCRLKDIKELFRAVGLGARAYTIVAQGEIGRIVTAKGDERRTILEEAAGVQGFREKIAVAERRLKDTSINISRIDDIINEVDRQVKSLKRQASKAKNRESLKEQIRDLEEQIYFDQCLKIKKSLKAINAKRESITKEIECFDSGLKEIINSDQTVKEELDGLDEKVNKLREQVTGIRDNLNQKQIAKATIKSKLSNTEIFISTNQNTINQTKERIASFSERLSPIEEELTNLNTTKDEKTKFLETLNRETYVRVKEKQDSINNLDVKLQGARKNQQLKRESLVHTEAELRAIEKQIRNLLIKSGALNKNEENKDKQILLDKIEVQPNYARAMQAVLSDFSAYQIVEDPFIKGKKYIDEIKKNSGKQVSGYIRTSSNDITVADVLLDCCKSLKTLFSCADINSEVSNSVKSILANSFVVSEIDEAIEFLSRNIREIQTSGINVKLVTLKGDILTANAFIPFTENSGLIELQSQKTELITLLEKQQGEFDVAMSEVESLKTHRSSLEEELRMARKEHDEQQNQIRICEQELARLDGQINGQIRSKANLENSIEHAEKEILVVIEKLAEYEARKQEISNELASIDNDDEENKLREQLASTNDSFQELERVRISKREELIAITNKIDSKRRQLEQGKQRFSDSNVNLERLNVELRYLLENAETAENKTLVDLLSNINEEDELKLTDQELKSAKEELSQIKKRIVREGDVDSSSIERLEEESARLEDLTVQRKDLNDAKHTLKSTISKLREISTERFLKTYEAIRSNFSILIPRLFGGGKGELTLSDINNPLDAELLISVRPPGKKLKSLELLSGGEKAICATGLIFAMFLERPSPLCILDEVDAPLDDANVGRFLNAVKEMSSKTQFIMVTHNKQSMSVADNLVGVTMQQPGASKVLQVSLQEAYSHVA